MVLLEDELTIISIADLLSIDLTLPSYQRPYRWKISSANTLFIDTFESYKNSVEEYRLGTVILHKNSSGTYNIVDGQQRITTLSILLYSLGDKKQKMLEETYSQLSNDAVVKNFRILSRRINELNDDEQNKYKKYLLEQCTMVQIVTDSEQEAFQFFDSQNTRGKELAPHDLLKSYHLREMDKESEDLKVQIINQWENINTNILKDLFSIYLYPLTQWYMLRDGLNYSSTKIDSFKGIKGNNIYNFSLYHKASNLYVEQFNKSGNSELLASNHLNQFQLTHPLIAGKRFFNYSLHYKELLEKVQNIIINFHNTEGETIPDRRSGDIYIKQLYESVALFFADRFGIESLTKSVLQQLYTWSYSLRLSMYAVYPQTINKYANGVHERVNEGLAMFSVISQMSDPEELKLIILEQPEIRENNDERYKESYKLLCEWNGWYK